MGIISLRDNQRMNRLVVLPLPAENSVDKTILEIRVEFQIMATLNTEVLYCFA